MELYECKRYGWRLQDAVLNCREMRTDCDKCVYIQLRMQVC